MKNTPTPIIFLAFANERQDDARHLRNLPREITLIRQALEPVEAAELCEAVLQSNARIENIIDTFLRSGRLAPSPQ